MRPAAGTGRGETRRPTPGMGRRRLQAAGGRAPGGTDRGPRNVDPRIWARRVAVARHAGRRRLRRLQAVAALVTVVALVLVLLHSGWFEARHRQLRGAVRTPASAVWREAGISSATPLVDVSPGAAAARIERLPWIARAMVVRHWPDAITVTVRERVPVAVVGQGAAAVVVDRTGRVLAPAAGIGGTLPTLISVAAPAAPGRWVAAGAAPGLTAAAAVPPVLAGRVQQVVVGQGGQVTLGLAGGITVMLGAATALRAKFESLAAVLADPASAPTGPAAIDVRSPAEPTVGPPTPA